MVGRCYFISLLVVVRKSLQKLLASYKAICGSSVNLLYLSYGMLLLC
jgi:hypothetical protein